MPKQKTDIPQIVEVKLSELVIDTSLAGRTEKEIRTNAKSLAPLLESYGGWDARQPGEFFVRDGKKHLAAGFTRVAAAESAGLKVGYFVEIEDDRAKLRVTCIRTNAGKPLSTYEYGRRYSAMRAGDDPEKARKGDVILAPMTTAEIAAEVGASRQWVESAISIFESTPEIAELILDGKVSPNIVARANQLVKADGKRLAFLKAAYNLAVSEGKQTATMQHLNAVRPDYAPLKAARPASNGVKMLPSAPTKGENAQAEGKSEPREEKSEPSAQTEMPMETSTPKPSAAAKKTQHEKIAGAIAFVSNERGLDLDDADIEAIAAAIVRLESNTPF